MSYASTADYAAAFGADELAQLVAQGRDVEGALAVAHAEADGYLGQRYRLPVLPADEKLKRTVLDIARYQLYGVSAEGEPQKRYEAAVAWLKDVVARRAGIPGALPAEDTTGIATPGQSPARSGQAVSNYDWDAYA